MAEGQVGGPQDAQQVPPWWTDPTENVKRDIAASERRMDDLRGMEARLREMEARHVRELMARDRDAARELRLAETQRINAILSENAGNVQRAADVQQAQQQALAAQVAQSAETVRQQMTATATTVAETLRTTVAPMLTRLDELSRAQYETQGQKQQVVETRDIRGDTRMSQQALVAIAALVIAVLTFLFLYVTKK
jgi:hypothetical protein